MQTLWLIKFYTSDNLVIKVYRAFFNVLLHVREQLKIYNISMRGMKMSAGQHM